MKLLILSAITAVILGASLEIYAEKKKILVLGFRSAEINDIQDSWLREAVMRNLIKRGFKIVPVMEVERFLENREYSSIRYPHKKEIKKYCDDTGAGFAVSGKITIRKNGSGKAESGAILSCEVKVYDTEGEVIFEDSFIIQGKNDMLALIEKSAESISALVSSSMSN